MKGRGRGIIQLVAVVLILCLSSCVTEEESKKKGAPWTWTDFAAYIDQQLGETSDGTARTCGGAGTALGEGAHCKNGLLGTASPETVVQYVQLTNDTLLWGDQDTTLYNDGAFFQRGLAFQENMCTLDLNFDNVPDYLSACMPSNIPGLTGASGIGCFKLDDNQYRVEYTDCLLTTANVTDAAGTYNPAAAATPVAVVLSAAVKPQSLSIKIGNTVEAADNGLGVVTGANLAAAGSINYATRALNFTFKTGIRGGTPAVTVTYTGASPWKLDGTVEIYAELSADFEQTILTHYVEGFEGTNVNLGDGTNFKYTVSGDVVTYQLIDHFQGNPAIGTTGAGVDGMVVLDVDVTVQNGAVFKGYPIFIAEDFEDGWVFLAQDYSGVWLGSAIPDVADPTMTLLDFFDRNNPWNNLVPGCRVDVAGINTATRTFNFSSPTGCMTGGVGAFY